MTTCQHGFEETDKHTCSLCHYLAQQCTTHETSDIETLRSHKRSVKKLLKWKGIADPDEDDQSDQLKF